MRSMISFPRYSLTRRTFAIKSNTKPSKAPKYKVLNNNPQVISTNKMLKQDLPEGRRLAVEELKIRARELKLDISENELMAIASKMPIDMHGRMTTAMYDQWLKSQTHPAVERLALLAAVWEQHKLSAIHKGMLLVDYFGTSLYAALGTICAGEAGMHVVGASLVGCVAGLGGGTLNSVMMGHTPVGWMTNTRWLAVCLASSITTFYAW